MRSTPDRPDRPLVIAHRGASRERPENTLAAFERALELGVDGVELDVHLTRDGHPVVIHDERLDRTTDGSGPVGDHTLAELRRLDAGAWFDAAYRGERIPTLAEVLERVGRHPLLINIELKTDRIAYPGLERRVGAILERAGCVERAVVSSFRPATLRKIREAAPSVRIGLLYARPLIAPVRKALRLGATSLHPPHFLTPASLVRRAHGSGLRVFCWTVNDLAVAHRLIAAKVDGLITDDPATLVREHSGPARPL
jgi:glycerophosphoryl diester phosphodiesterase